MWYKNHRSTINSTIIVKPLLGPLGKLEKSMAGSLFLEGLEVLGSSSAEVVFVRRVGHSERLKELLIMN